MELKIFLRQHIITDNQNNERYYAGYPGSLTIVQGRLPVARQFAGYGNYIDVTDAVSDLHKLKLSWSMERNAEGLVVSGPSNQKKSASGTLTFEGAAYQYLKKWLVDDDSAQLNAMDIKIEHVGVGAYTEWAVKATDMSWCDDGMCYFNITLKQGDEALKCIRNTMIADDWQGWFGESMRPRSGKRHPRFSYCNEIRPNGMLVTLWWTITQLMSILGPFAAMIALVVNPIISFMKNFVIPMINTIIRFCNSLGANIELLEMKADYIERKDIEDIFGNFFIESAGCGREHPAPLIRDYIANVCSKCKINVGPDTVPLFFSESMFTDVSSDDEGEIWRDNPYYNACYFHGMAEKGIRRYSDLNIWNGAVYNMTDWWQPGNTPLLTLDMFLDELKKVFNCEWRVENNTLYFLRKDHWLNDDEEFDFSEGSADRQYLLEGICYEWDDTKQPVYAKGLYSPDAADVCGNNACNQMNGYVSFGSIDTDPLLDGVMDKTVQMGATKFRLDGASTDYLFDAMQQVVNTTLITGSVWTPSLIKSVNDYVERYADYALLLKQETAVLPKILIWDGASIVNARCVRLYNAKYFPALLPPINTKYNSSPWPYRHESYTKVSGENMVPGSKPLGMYTVRGAGIITQKNAMLVNYPMYFEPGYKGTLWDWFHWIDDPKRSPKRHQKFSLKMELCKDLLERVKPFDDAANIILGQKVKLPLPFVNEGRITEIEISYDTSDKLGPYILLKGTV